MTTYGIDRTQAGGGTGASTTVLLADGSQPLTGNWAAGNYDITALSFIASGTSPTFELIRALDTQANAIEFQEADGSVRWKLNHAGTGSSNDFSLIRYNASGVLQDSPISVSSSTGAVTIPNDLKFGGIATADTFVRRNTGNTAWEAKTPQQVADEVGPLYAEPLVVQARLDYTNSTTITLNKHNGDRVPIYDGTRWVYRTIGTPPTASNAALGNFTSRYVYAYWTGSALALELSATGYTTQGGMPVKTGDATRLLVGYVCTNGSGVFADSVTERMTKSYWNRTVVSLQQAVSGANQVNTSTWENLGGSFIRFLTWANEPVYGTITADCSNLSATTCYCAMGIDSQSTPTWGSGASIAAGGVASISSSLAYTYSEGLHYLAHLGFTTVANTTWNSYLTGTVQV